MLCELLAIGLVGGMTSRAWTMSKPTLAELNLTPTWRLAIVAATRWMCAGVTNALCVPRDLHAQQQSGARGAGNSAEQPSRSAGTGMRMTPIVLSLVSFVMRVCMSQSKTLDTKPRDFSGLFGGFVSTHLSCLVRRTDSPAHSTSAISGRSVAALRMCRRVSRSKCGAAS